MRSKINVYQHKDTPIHRWNVYNTYTDKRDKYDLYFKNRFTVKNGWEKYDNLVPLDNDYVLYKLFYKGIGAQNSIWKTGTPDLANFNAYQQGLNDIALNNLPTDVEKYVKREWTTSGYTFTFTPETPIQNRNIIKNTLGELGVGETADDIIQTEDGWYQRVYLERFSGTGNLYRSFTVYPSGLASPNNIPNHWIKNFGNFSSQEDRDAVMAVRDMYNPEVGEPWLSNSHITSTELSFYLFFENEWFEPTPAGPLYLDNVPIYFTIKRNLDVSSYCVPCAAKDQDPQRQYERTAFGFYEVQSNYYYDRFSCALSSSLGSNGNQIRCINYDRNLGNIFESHSWNGSSFVPTEQGDWIKTFLQTPNLFNWQGNITIDFTNLQKVPITDQTFTSPVIFGVVGTNKYLDETIRVRVNDPFPMVDIVNPTDQNSVWYDFELPGAEISQSFTIGLNRNTKTYTGNDVYSNVIDSASAAVDNKTAYWHNNGEYWNNGIEWGINPNYINYITVSGAEPAKISPLVKERHTYWDGEELYDMDNYGVFRIANPNPQSAEEYIYYTWKGFNEEYTEIDKTGGVFYSADFYFCQKVKIGDNWFWQKITNLKSDYIYYELINSIYGGLLLDRSSIIWPNPITDDNYNNYLYTRTDFGEDTLYIGNVENYHLDFIYNPRTNKVEIETTMVVGHKNDSYPNKYTIKGKLVSYDNINDFLNEDFDTTFFQYQYTFNTNTTLYVNGLIEAHKGDYPYAESPYRAIVDGKLNLAWRREDYHGYNNGLAVYSENITLPIEDFNELINTYINTDVIGIEGFQQYESIDLDSLRYGFSYDTEIYFPYRTIFDWEILPSNIKGFRVIIDYTQLQNLFDNWYDNSIWQPSYVYSFTFPSDSPTERVAHYERIQPTHTEYNWHPMGIMPYRYWLKGPNDTATIQTSYVETSKENYLYEIIFELAEPVPANTFYLETTDWIKTNLMATFAEPDPNEIYIVNETYQVEKPSDKIREWKYTTKPMYDASTEERWLTQIVYEFPSGMLVPNKHWPQMLYEDKRYKDVEIVSSDEMTYPNLGYYPPKEEMLPDNFKTELEEGQAIYRYIGFINEYYSTVKAGSIYLPAGADIEEELYLTPYDIKCENDYIETNPYGYKYIGEVDYVNKNMLLRVATSTDFGAYPKDGPLLDGYWYEYIGTDEEVEYIWGDKELRNSAIYNIDINSNQDFTIGDVAGASFTVDIQGSIRDTIKYLGRKCRLFYDFENKDEFKDYGLFTIEDVKFINHQVSTITAYDNIKKFDAPVYEYLTSENVEALYPMTAKMLFQLMCEYCEVPYYTSMDFLNSDTLIYGPFGDANLTARQALSYVAEIAAGYIVCDNNGYAVLKTHKPYLEIRDSNDNYITQNENIIDLIDNPDASIYRETNMIEEQVNQRMDVFPTELIDSIVFNNVDTESFINYRKELNAIYDLSDNPFLTFVETQEEADEITNGILDQIAILIPVLYDTETSFYAGEIELKNFELSTFGTKQIVDLLEEEKDYDYFIPTGITINSSGIILTSKGQPKYSTKIVNSELAKQVNSLKMNIKEIKLTIPDALADTLDSHGTQINTLEGDVGDLQSSLTDVEGTVSTLDTNLSTLENNVSEQNTANSNRFRTIESKDQEQDGRLDAIELKDTGYDTDIAAIQTKNTNQDTAISANATAITNLTTTVGGLPTKTYVDNLNQVNSITNGWKLSIGEDEVSFYTDNGYLFISDGTTTWKLKLEVNA